MTYTTPTTDDGTPGPIPNVETFTVARLIEELQKHIEIDPERADYPVAIAVLGQSAAQCFLPAVVGTTGNDDPGMGGPLRVTLYSIKHRP